MLNDNVTYIITNEKKMRVLIIIILSWKQSGLGKGAEDIWSTLRYMT